MLFINETWRLFYIYNYFQASKQECIFNVKLINRPIKGDNQSENKLYSCGLTTRLKLSSQSNLSTCIVFCNQLGYIMIKTSILFKLCMKNPLDPTTFSPYVRGTSTQVLLLCKASISSCMICNNSSVFKAILMVRGSDRMAAVMVFKLVN